MRIAIKVKPNSKRPGVEKLETGEYLVRVNAPPVDGKANKAVLEALATHFGVPKSKIEILKGEKGKQKLVEIGGI